MLYILAVDYKSHYILGTYLQKGFLSNGKEICYHNILLNQKKL